MKNKILKLLALKVTTISCIFSLISFQGFALNSESGKFSDVPDNHWAADSIYKLKSLNITKGIEQYKFGIGRTLKRDEFLGLLIKLMNIKLYSPDKSLIKDNLDKKKWYYGIIETAVKSEIISVENGYARPEDLITREEMAIMIVRALGYQGVALKIDGKVDCFSDVVTNKGYISMAREFGIVSGVGDNKFNSKGNATREESAVMICNMYQKLKTPLKELNAFYTTSSYKQIGRITDLTTCSFGWGEIKFDQTTKGPKLEVNYPKGFETPLKLTSESSISANLSILLTEDVITLENGDKTTVAQSLLSNKNKREEIISGIVKELEKSKDELKGGRFTGVVIDFEGIRGEELRGNFIIFLKELKQKLGSSNKKIYVTVQPKVLQGSIYFDGYDYQAISEIADKVILMAHDYAPKTLSDTDMQNGFVLTPMSPGYEVYYALKLLTDGKDGIKDRSKILLQISFSSIQWKLKDGKVINKNPYTPDYNRILQRLEKSNTNILYSNEYNNTYAKFFEPSDSTDNVLWYEDSKSVDAKIRFAKFFGTGGVSLWRMGEVPDGNGTGSRDVNFDVFNGILEGGFGK